MWKHLSINSSLPEGIPYLDLSDEESIGTAGRVEPCWRLGSGKWHRRPLFNWHELIQDISGCVIYLYIYIHRYTYPTRGSLSQLTLHVCIGMGGAISSQRMSSRNPGGNLIPSPYDIGIAMGQDRRLTLLDLYGSLLKSRSWAVPIHACVWVYGLWMNASSRPLKISHVPMGWSSICSNQTWLHG